MGLVLSTSMGLVFSMLALCWLRSVRHQPDLQGCLGCCALGCCAHGMAILAHLCCLSMACSLHTSPMIVQRTCTFGDWPLQESTEQ